MRNGSSGPDESYDGFGHRGAKADRPEIILTGVQVKLLVDTSAASEFDRSS